MTAHDNTSISSGCLTLNSSCERCLTPQNGSLGELRRSHLRSTRTGPNKRLKACRPSLAVQTRGRWHSEGGQAQAQAQTQEVLTMATIGEEHLHLKSFTPKGSSIRVRAVLQQRIRPDPDPSRHNMYFR